MREDQRGEVVAVAAGDGAGRVRPGAGPARAAADGAAAGSPRRAAWAARLLALRDGSPAYWFVIFAVFAAIVGAVSGGEDAVWGRWAAAGYALAAVLARRPRWTGWALAAACAGALIAPAVWLAWRYPLTADVTVVTRSAQLLLRHGSPYLPPGQLASWRDYDPYLPGMALFGLPRALGLPGLAGDSRFWLMAVTAAVAWPAFAVGWRRTGAPAGRRLPPAGLAALACSSPLLAFPLAVGITDPPMIALLCLGFAYVAVPQDGRRRAGRAIWPAAAAAGLAVGAAAAMKATAWPAVAVITVMLARRDGVRAAVTFAAATAATTAGVIAATAPALTARPAALLHNTVLFPLGLTAQHTPAASPLPGHLLAGLGHAGRIAAICLVIAAATGVAGWLVARPPADVRAAVWRLAAGLALLFALAPASRFGYLAYPAGLLGWLGLTHSLAPGEPGAARRRRASAAPAGGTLARPG